MLKRDATQRIAAVAVTTRPAPRATPVPPAHRSPAITVGEYQRRGARNGQIGSARETPNHSCGCSKAGSAGKACACGAGARKCGAGCACGSGQQPNGAQASAAADVAASVRRLAARTTRLMAGTQSSYRAGTAGTGGLGNLGPIKAAVQRVCMVTLTAEQHSWLEAARAAANQTRHKWDFDRRVHPPTCADLTRGQEATAGWQTGEEYLWYNSFLGAFHDGTPEHALAPSIPPEAWNWIIDLSIAPGGPLMSLVDSTLGERTISTYTDTGAQCSWTGKIAGELPFPDSYPVPCPELADPRLAQLLGDPRFSPRTPQGMKMLDAIRGQVGTERPCRCRACSGFRGGCRTNCRYTCGFGTAYVCSCAGACPPSVDSIEELLGMPGVFCQMPWP